MSRTASMQVLNQAFANLNNAFNRYMQNKRAKEELDFNERKWNEELQFDRNKWKEYLALKQSAEARNQADSIAKRQTGLMGIADKYGMDTAAAYNLALKGDPMAENLIVKGVANAVKRKELNDRYNQLEKMYFDMQKADRERQYKMQGDEAARIHDLQMLNEKNRFAAAENEKNRALQKDMEAQKMAAARNENTLKYAIPYIQSTMGNSESNSPVDMEKAAADYLRLSSMLNGTYRPNKGAENALNTARSIAAK